MRRTGKMCMVLLLCGGMLISSCKSGGQSNQNNMEKVTENEEKNDTIDNGKPKKEEKLDLEHYSLDYEPETDFQPFFWWSSATNAGSNYFFWVDSDSMLAKFDPVTKKAQLICGKSGCKHWGVTDKSEYLNCDAYFSNGELTGNRLTNMLPGTLGKKETVTFQTGYIQYYKKNLYVMGFDKNADVYLYKISKDGSKREKDCLLFKADLSSSKHPEDSSQSEWNSPEVCIHRGYAYFIDNREQISGQEGTPSIRRVKLGSDEEPELVFEAEGQRPSIYRMLGYGDYIFFQSGNFKDAAYNDIDGAIYAYNIQTGKITLVKNNVIAPYCIQDDKLYYDANIYSSDDKSIHCYSLSTQQDEVFAKTGDRQEAVDVFVDKNYVYTTGDTENEIMIYDRNSKKLVQRLNDDNCYMCLYGDDKLLFHVAENGNFINFLDKAKCKDGNAVWEDARIEPAK